MRENWLHLEGEGRGSGGDVENGGEDIGGDDSGGRQIGGREFGGREIESGLRSVSGGGEEGGDNNMRDKSDRGMGMEGGGKQEENIGVLGGRVVGGRRERAGVGEGRRSEEREFEESKVIEGLLRTGSVEEAEERKVGEEAGSRGYGARGLRNEEGERKENSIMSGNGRRKLHELFGEEEVVLKPWLLKKEEEEGEGEQERGREGHRERSKGGGNSNKNEKENGKGEGRSEGEGEGESEQEEEGGGGEVAKGFRDEFDDPIHDIVEFQRRRKVLGNFVSQNVKDKYWEQGEYNGGRGTVERDTLEKGREVRETGARYREERVRVDWGRQGNERDEREERGREEWRNIGVIPRFGSYKARFGEGVVALLESTVHLPSSFLEEEETPPTVFFPGDQTVLSSWTRGISQLLLGPQIEVLPGKVPAQQICFRNALFALNSLHSERSADIIRNIGKKIVKRRKEAETSVETESSSDSTVVKTDGHDDRSIYPRAKIAGGLSPILDIEANGRDGRWLRELDDVAGGQGKRWMQATVIEREGHRTVQNVPELGTLIQTVIPEIRVEIVRLTNATLAKQIELMQRSALFLSMHGSSLNDIIFMPRGAVVLELLPFKFSSDHYKKIAIRSGLHYLSWANVHSKNSYYPNDCMRKGNFDKLDDKSCLKNSECVFCVRDESVTGVHARELVEVLRNARIVLQKWITPEFGKTK